MKFNYLLPARKTVDKLSFYILTFAILVLLSLPCFSQGPNVKYNPPIRISKGGTYSGNWQSNDSNTPAVLIATSEPVVIQNSIIRSAGHLIYANNVKANVTIKNTQGYGLVPTVNNRARGRFFWGYVVTKAVLENNYFEGTSGVLIERFEGNKSGSETIKFRYNKAKNIDGRHRQSGGKSFAQLVQLNECRQVKNVVIAWNEVINEYGKGYVEDNINIHKSSGTSDSPIQIHDNYVQGAFPLNANVSGYSGGGILLADGSGNVSTVTSWVRAFNNQIVGTTNHGIAIAGGHNNLIYNNRVVSSGKVLVGSSEVTLAAQNVGIYIWNLHNNPASVFFNNSARDNVSGWAKHSLPSKRNDYWLINGVNLTNNQSISGNITRQHEIEEFNSWKKKVSSKGITVGLLSGSTPVVVQPSSISISSPSNNATFTAGSNVSISVAATGNEQVKKVEFYNGSSKLGEDTSSPYSYVWNSVKAGTHSITVKATYSNNSTKTSEAIRIQVGSSGSNPPPTASGQKIEAENYSKLSDPGGNAIQVIGVSNHSGGKSVRLFDKGDKIRITFNSTAGTYQIRARVRSGYYNSSSSNSTSYWPNGYVFTVNGQTTTFSGNSSTISGKDGSFGGSYFGTMTSSNVNLRSGSNTVDIASNADWAAIDYIELVPQNSSAQPMPSPSPAPIVIAPPASGGQKIEVESAYSKLADVGSNAIGEMSGNFSNGKSIRLFDVGDKIRITFNSAGGNYIVKARVRSGYYNTTSAGTTSYFNKYSFAINGSTEKFSGDGSTISGRESAYGGSYWGTMNSSTVSLRSGSNTLDISTSAAFLGVDYIEIVPISSGARLAFAEEAEEEIASTEFVVFPNPVQNTLNIDGIHSSEQIALSLYYSSGQPIFVNHTIEPENNKVSIDLNSYQLKSGYYILKVNDGGKEVDRRIFKQ